MEIKGIDVSSWQGKPDWAKVSNSGIKLAILRIHQKSGTDASFEHNYKGCKSNGILIGGYKYSYALTPAQAIDEAEDVLSVLGGRGLDFPVFYDLEWSQQRSLGKQAIENVAIAFLTRIKKAGYKVGIYCNLDWYNNVLTDALKKYDCWIARYPASDNGSVQERLRPNVGVGWQYSSKAKIPGISGTVDRNIFYKDYNEAKDIKKENAVMTKSEAINVVLGIAKEEIGYLEKKNNSKLDSKTGNAGSAGDSSACAGAPDQPAGSSAGSPFQRGIRGNTSHRFPRYPGAVFGKSCHGRGVSLCLQPERKLQPQNAGKV